MIIKPRGKIGVADVSDLTRNKVVRWQHKNYLTLLFTMGVIVPTLVAGLGWGDWRGGFFFAAAARLCLCPSRELPGLNSVHLAVADRFPLVHVLCQLARPLAR